MTSATEHSLAEPGTGQDKASLRGSLIAHDFPPPTLDLSIVMALFNRQELTRACLTSLEATLPPHLSYEVILVDDGSTDGTREYLHTLKAPYRIYFNDEQAHYAHNNNLGGSLALGRILAFLNNDLELTPGWLDPMLVLLENSPQAGCVGNIHLNPNTGLIDHAGVAFSLNGETFHRHKNRKRLPANSFREVNALSSACMLIRREHFHALGGFDESYVNGSEDIDFCIRLRLSGYRIYISHESKVFHYVSSSPGRFKHNSENRIRLRQKWEPIMLTWAKQEWASAYLSRYARHFWKTSPKNVLLAVSQSVRQCLKRQN